MADTKTPPPPAGFFAVLGGRPSFSRWNGPYCAEANQPDGVRNAFFALPQHSDDGEVVAQAMAMAFLDGVMAQAVTRGAGIFGVTIELSLQLSEPAPLGQWVYGEARMIGSDAKLAFVDGRITAGGRDVVRASGVFKLMQPPHKGGRRYS